MRDAVRRPAGGLRQHARDRAALRLHAARRASRSCRSSPKVRAGSTEERDCARHGASRASSARLAPLAARCRRRAARYRERLDYELDVIVKMGFAGYFLIVADFIQWAKAQGIPVGPGRGSGAGSVVAWALTITDLDPLRFGLLFERFLNPERVSMPDFDIDFCQDRRDEVIGYVAARIRRATAWRRSSPSASCRRAPWCAMSAACSACPTARSTASAKLIPNNPAQPGDLAAGDRRRAAAAGDARRATRRSRG